MSTNFRGINPIVKYMNVTASAYLDDNFLVAKLLESNYTGILTTSENATFNDRYASYTHNAASGLQFITTSNKSLYTFNIADGNVTATITNSTIDINGENTTCILSIDNDNSNFAREENGLQILSIPGAITSDNVQVKSVVEINNNQDDVKLHNDIRILNHGGNMTLDISGNATALLNVTSNIPADYSVTLNSEPSFYGYGSFNVSVPLSYITITGDGRLININATTSLSSGDVDASYTYDAFYSAFAQNIGSMPNVVNDSSFTITNTGFGSNGYNGNEGNNTNLYLTFNTVSTNNTNDITVSASIGVDTLDVTNYYITLNATQDILPAGNTTDNLTLTINSTPANRYDIASGNMTNVAIYYPGESEDSITQIVMEQALPTYNLTLAVRTTVGHGNTSNDLNIYNNTNIDIFNIGAHITDAYMFHLTNGTFATLALEGNISGVLNYTATSSFGGRELIFPQITYRNNGQYEEPTTYDDYQIRIANNPTYKQLTSVNNIDTESVKLGNPYGDSPNSIIWDLDLILNTTTTNNFTLSVLIDFRTYENNINDWINSTVITYSGNNEDFYVNGFPAGSLNYIMDSGTGGKTVLKSTTDGLRVLSTNATFYQVDISSIKLPVYVPYIDGATIDMGSKTLNIAEYKTGTFTNVKLVTINNDGSGTILTGNNTPTIDNVNVSFSRQNIIPYVVQLEGLKTGEEDPYPMGNTELFDPFIDNSVLGGKLITQNISNSSDLFGDALPVEHFIIPLYPANTYQVNFIRDVQYIRDHLTGSTQSVISQFIIANEHENEQATITNDGEKQTITLPTLGHSFVMNNAPYLVDIVGFYYAGVNTFITTVNLGERRLHFPVDGTAIQIDSGVWGGINDGNLIESVTLKLKPDTFSATLYDGKVVSGNVTAGELFPSTFSEVVGTNTTTGLITVQKVLQFNNSLKNVAAGPSISLGFTLYDTTNANNVTVGVTPTFTIPDGPYTLSAIDGTTTYILQGTRGYGGAQNNTVSATRNDFYTTFYTSPFSGLLVPVTISFTGQVTYDVVETYTTSTLSSSVYRGYANPSTFTVTRGRVSVTVSQNGTTDSFSDLAAPAYKGSISSSRSFDVNGNTGTWTLNQTTIGDGITSTYTYSQGNTPTISINGSNELLNALGWSYLQVPFNQPNETSITITYHQGDIVVNNQPVTPWQLALNGGYDVPLYPQVHLSKQTVNNGRGGETFTLTCSEITGTLSYKRPGNMSYVESLTITDPHDIVTDDGYKIDLCVNLGHLRSNPLSANLTITDNDISVKNGNNDIYLPPTKIRGSMTGAYYSLECVQTSISNDIDDNEDKTFYVLINDPNFVPLIGSSPDPSSPDHYAWYTGINISPVPSMRVDEYRLGYEMDNTPQVVPVVYKRSSKLYNRIKSDSDLNQGKVMSFVADSGVKYTLTSGKNSSLFTYLTTNPYSKTQQTNPSTYPATGNPRNYLQEDVSETLTIQTNSLGNSIELLDLQIRFGANAKRDYYKLITPSALTGPNQVDIVKIVAPDQFVLCDWLGNLSLRVGPTGILYTGDIATYSNIFNQNTFNSNIVNSANLPFYNANLALSIPPFTNN